MEEELEELKKKVRELLEAIRYFNDGCGCCSSEGPAFNLKEFKELEDLV